ncbi:Uncharacterized protein OBRU01_07941 [Operophtera brumata]|uniref:Ionotropic receptor n=1 Tax=Operophtera brumata TaxID=104452 RepID=A0A0L7LIL9_OPEBR|nr:Uncharacterized protein OBRU01_07941 [Operophtera brumata]
MMLTKITLNLLIIQAIYCEDNFNLGKLSYDDENTNTIACIKSVVRKYFPCGALMTLVDSKEDGELIKSLNSENDCYSFIVRSYDDLDWYIPTPVYIIRAEDVTEFTTGILTITNDLFWNSRGRFIIELETLAAEDVETVFHILMKHKAYDVVLIRKSNNHIAIDTYYPFKDNNCGKKSEVATIGDCKDIAHLILFKTDEISLRNCTIKVAATQDIPNFIFENRDYNEDGKSLIGLEQFVLEAIAAKEGIKLEYIIKNQEFGFGIVLQNYTATGLLAMLQNHDADIAAGGFILIRNRVLLFDFIWGYNYAAFKVFTPAVGEEIWKDVYREFSSQTWILIVIAYCLVAVISTIRGKLILRKSQNQMCVALKLWGYLYLNTSSRLSKEKRFRIIMVFWLWFTFFVCNFYNTELYSLLTGRNQIKRQISSDRLRELPYDPCISLSSRTFFLFALNQNLPEGRDIPECKFTDTALDFVATQKNVYAIEMEYIYTLNEYKYTDGDGNPMLDTWSFSINNVIAMYLARGFPLKHKFQWYALRMYESGLLEEQLNKINRIKNRNPQPLHKVHFEPMWLSDLRIHFCILLLGSVLSMVCFAVEVLWYHYSKTLKAKWWT